MKETTFDQDLLTQRISQRFGTQKAFAEAMEMSPRALSNRLHNRTDWMYTEMQKAVSLLELDRSDVECCFFHTVENTETTVGRARPGDSARRSLYFMSQEISDNEAIFLYTLANKLFYAGKYDDESLKTNRDHLIDCVLGGMEECKDESLLDLIRRLLWKSNEKAKKETA